VGGIEDSDLSELIGQLLGGGAGAHAGGLVIGAAAEGLVSAFLVFRVGIITKRWLTAEDGPAHMRSLRRTSYKEALASMREGNFAATVTETLKQTTASTANAAVNAVADVRMFRDLFGGASLGELTHADMLQLRDALVRSGVCRRTVNDRLNRIKYMIAWALDEAIIPATVKAELTQVKPVKRGRTTAPERAPVRPVDDATIAATVEKMMPNTADMVRVHRLTGMRPGELCALRWSLIDTSRTPWVYRVPPEANKNNWRGELGQPRVVCIGPRARAILERHKGGDDVPFSPVRAMLEYMEARRAARVTPFYGKKKGAETSQHVPRVLGSAWTTNAYTKTIHAACRRAGLTPWGANRLRHAFATDVRRAFGLDAARAVLGHAGGGCVTDVYTFDALADEMVRAAAPAVEALG
jgi:integrase